MEFEITEEIAAPPETVFDTLADLDAMAEWMPHLVRVERMTPGFGPGTRFRGTRKMLGRESTEEFEVTRFDRPRLIELHVDGRKGTSGRGEFRFRHELEPVGGRTRVKLHGQVSGGGFMMKLLGKALMGPMKKAVAKDLAALKSYLEKSVK